MIVGFHAPLPPVRSGVADYAARLLVELRKHGRVDLTPANADVHLYHLGNNPLHRDIYTRFLANPGVTVLHDALLQHFYLGALDRARYVEEYIYNYGEWERALAGDLYSERAGSGMDHRFFARPMLKRVAELSRLVIVHNPAAAHLVRAHSPSANVMEIPHFFEEPPPILPGETDRLRAQWHTGQSNVIFGIFGFLRESKRVLPILHAFHQLHKISPHARLLLAGQFASPDLERAVQPWLQHPGVLRAGYLNEADFWRVASAVDCCLNLRAPSAGETSGIGIRLMGLGKPVFFTEGREIENFPADSCFRVSPGIEERAELFEYMKIVVDLPHYARAIGSRAAAHIRGVHSLPRIAGLYWKALCDVRAAS